MICTVVEPAMGKEDTVPAVQAVPDALAEDA
jgi:hypothetical protein